MIETAHYDSTTRSNKQKLMIFLQAILVLAESWVLGFGIRFESNNLQFIVLGFLDGHFSLQMWIETDDVTLNGG